MWVKADKINGYVCGFRVYVGKQGNNTKMGLGSNVVIELTKAIVGKNYTGSCKGKNTN